MLNKPSDKYLVNKYIGYIYIKYNIFLTNKHGKVCQSDLINI